ncbi:hypothetical protein B5F40_01985 [Gordonibacter sp. An230]|nr:hypothetical protein B5F40_01985 [Gordonibacter sp. An230]
MKVCPVCHARAFDDAEVCFGCLHRFGASEPGQSSEKAREKGPSNAEARFAWAVPDGSLSGARSVEGSAARPSPSMCAASPPTSISASNEAGLAASGSDRGFAGCGAAPAPAVPSKQASAAAFRTGSPTAHPDRGSTALAVASDRASPPVLSSPSSAPSATGDTGADGLSALIAELTERLRDIDVSRSGPCPFAKEAAASLAETEALAFRVPSAFGWEPRFSVGACEGSAGWVVRFELPDGIVIEGAPDGESGGGKGSAALSFALRTRAKDDRSSTEKAVSTQGEGGAGPGGSAGAANRMAGSAGAVGPKPPSAKRHASSPARATRESASEGALGAAGSSRTKRSLGEACGSSSRGAHARGSLGVGCDPVAVGEAS